MTHRYHSALARCCGLLILMTGVALTGT